MGYTSNSKGGGQRFLNSSVGAIQSGHEETEGKRLLVDNCDTTDYKRKRLFGAMKRVPRVLTRQPRTTSDKKQTSRQPQVSCRLNLVIS